MKKKVFISYSYQDRDFVEWLKNNLQELGLDIWYDQAEMRELKFSAKFPHMYDTWLGEGHTISNGNPPEPMSDNTSFVGVILLPSVTLPEDFMTIKSGDKTIHIYSMIPLYQEEMDYKLKQGTSGLLSKFAKHDIKEVIDIKRPNSCKKRFLLF